MRLTRIRIEQFRQFRQALEIADLDPGLNLFTGPNEAGKSTLVAAIRAAFFERHRSGSVDDLRPWGDASAAPTVELDFELDGTPYRLSKSFLGKKRCELRIGQGGAQRLEGVEAEDRLAELLGFQHAGKGASKAEHWGIPGLLWIQQGGAQDIREPVDNAKDHLRTALNESLGEVASSSGDGVLAAVETMRNELLTPAAGAPRGAYAEAIRRRDELAGKLAELDAEIGGYRQRVDTLASLRREHAADEAEKPWAALRQQEREAAARLEEIQAVEKTLREHRERQPRIETQVGLLRNQLATFASQEQETRTRVANLEAARLAQAAAAGQVEQWQSRSRQAAGQYEAARETLRLARQEDTRRGLARQLAELRAKAGEAASNLARAEAEQAALIELQTQAAASEIAARDLATLREQHQALRELRIRQAAAATRLRFTLEPGQSIRVGDDSVAGSGERQLLEPTPILLPGLGRLEIAPGGDAGLAELGRQEKALSDRQGALLQRLGLASLEAAEARQQTHAQRLADIKTAAATLKALAPKGIEALRAEQAGHAARAVEIEQALGKLPPAAAQTDPKATELPAISAAESAEQGARQTLEQTNLALTQARVAAANAQTAFDAASRELASAQAQLDDPDRARRLTAANQALVDALAEQAALAARIETAAAQVAQTRPDILRQDVERYGNSAAQHEKRHAERRDTLMRLEVELQTAGAQGLEERRAERARDLEQAQRRVRELQSRARALDHLLGLLRDKRQALTRRLQAPLQRHLNHYLQLLFPQASLEIDDELTPGILTRADANDSGDFEALSFGAREQMGVISRLAYADLLRAAGRPTLIILDDALVHSDEDRLARMKRVLFDAATRHQILLFTCHPGNWRDMGVSPRSLEAIRAAAIA